jgi:hypothetical protein
MLCAPVITQGGDSAMTAFNAVRFQVKPGRNQEFLDAHNQVDRDWPGLRHVNLIQTGEQAIASLANGIRWTR